MGDPNLEIQYIMKERKVEEVAKSVAKSAVNGLKSEGHAVVGKIKSAGRAVASLLRF